MFFPFDKGQIGVDWIGFDSPLPVGDDLDDFLIKTNKIQELDSYDGELVYEISKSFRLGSRFSNTTVGMRTTATDFELSGNFRKLYAGHSLSTSHTPKELLTRAITSINALLDLKYIPSKVLKLGWFNRLDLSMDFYFDHEAEARHFLSMVQHASKLGRVKPDLVRNTIYYNLEKKGVVLKIYDKTKQMKKGNDVFPDGVKDRLPYLIRVELKLKDKYIRTLYPMMSEELFNKDLLRRIFLSVVSELKIADNSPKLPIDQLRKLPRHTQLTFYKWRCGHLMDDDVSKATLYRHRREILDAVKVDVSMPLTHYGPDVYSKIEKGIMLPKFFNYDKFLQDS